MCHESIASASHYINADYTEQQTVWMLRLSYNTYRRGLFSFSDEDYRWPVLRARVPKWLFQVINISFIGLSLFTSTFTCNKLTQRLL
jgi:steroid 5-alpha reductase family enzyme